MSFPPSLLPLPPPPPRYQDRAQNCTSQNMSERVPLVHLINTKVQSKLAYNNTVFAMIIVSKLAIFLSSLITLDGGHMSRQASAPGVSSSASLPHHYTSSSSMSNGNGNLKRNRSFRESFRKKFNRYKGRLCSIHL